jgi:hypothetical protein
MNEYEELELSSLVKMERWKCHRVRSERSEWTMA